MPLKIFVDSDVVISSLISKSGAAHLLLFKKDSFKTTTNIQFYISNISKEEIKGVIKRLDLGESDFYLLIKNNLNVVKLMHTSLQLKKEYINYTNDPDDTHIIAGSKAAEAKFLISYNIKDFKLEKIHRDFDITLLTPAQLIQYLRSK